MNASSLSPNSILSLPQGSGQGFQTDSRAISFLRFPLMVGVVFIHSDLRNQCPDMSQLTVYGEFMALFNDFICGICVPLFFFISGYLFYKNWEKGAYGQKLRRRVRTVLTPYVLWNAICLAIIFALQTLRPGFNLLLHKQISDFSPTDFLYIFWDIRQVTGLPTDQAASLVGQFWFLQCLMVMIVLAPVIRFLVRRGGLFTLLVMFLAYAFDPLPPIPGIKMEAFFYFSLGAWLTTNRLSFSELTRSKTLPFLLPFLFLYLLNRYVLPYEADGIYATANIFLLTGILAFTTKMVLREKWRTSTFLAGSSFFVFAVHRFFTALLTNGVRLGYLPTDTSLVAMATYLLGALAVVACCLAVYYPMNRFLPRLTALLTGGR